jgi:hypothetical protein
MTTTIGRTRILPRLDLEGGPQVEELPVSSEEPEVSLV